MGHLSELRDLREQIDTAKRNVTRLKREEELLAQKITSLRVQRDTAQKILDIEKKKAAQLTKERRQLILTASEAGTSAIKLAEATGIARPNIYTEIERAKNA